MNTPTDDERIRQHADLVYRTCLRLTGNAQDAADVTQEVFVAWLRQHREIRGSVAGWLYGTARQRALDWLRTNHRRERHERAAAEQPAAVVTEDDWRQHLDSALEELPASVRTLVVEHHLLGLTQGQLATRHRCTQATISRRLTQALDLLRSALQSRGVTVSGAVLLVGFTSARVSACPAPLVAPVLAQAQVAGVSALVGPLMVGGLGLLGWSAIAAGVLLVLAICGGFGLWWWSAQVAHDLDRDWTAVATAHLPPVISAQPMVIPAGSPRYPSIEALIARQTPLDVARQARLAKLIAPDGEAPWSLVDDWSLTVLASVTGKLKSGEVLKADEAKAVARVYERIRPILDELHHADVALGAGAFLGRAYSDGRLAGNEQRGAWLRSRLGGQRAIGQQPGIGQVIASLLIHAALQASDPHAALVDLDAWVASYGRSAITIMEALQAQSLWEARDSVYQEMAWRGRLPVDAQQRWLAERCPTAGVMSDAIMGEVLLLLLPHLEDLRAGRVADQGTFEYAGLGPRLTWIPRHLEIIQRALTGQEAERYRALDAQAQAGEGSTYWPLIRVQAGMVALGETRHRARRLAVEILERARAGEALPEHLATDVARGSNSWGLRYERLSATRFTLVVDPDAGLPVCGLPEEVGTMRSRIQEARAKLRTKPLVNHALLIEMEVPPPSATEPVVLPSEPQPTEEIQPAFQSLAQ